MLKLLNFQDKTKILNNAKKLRNSGIYINEDFSEATMIIRKNLREQMLAERQKGKYCVLSYDRLIIRDFQRSVIQK